MALVNITELIVRETLNKILDEEYPDICRCDKCIDDMLAIVLNRLQPQYVSTPKGALFKRIDATLTQNVVDMKIVIVQAIEIVKSSPQH